MVKSDSLLVAVLLMLVLLAVGALFFWSFQPSDPYSSSSPLEIDQADEKSGPSSTVNDLKHSTEPNSAATNTTDDSAAKDATDVSSTNSNSSTDPTATATDDDAFDDVVTDDLSAEDEDLGKRVIAVSGRITDAETNAPIEGVNLLSYEAYIRVAMKRLNNRQVSQTDIQVLETSPSGSDADGNYSAKIIVPESYFNIDDKDKDVRIFFNFSAAQYPKTEVSTALPDVSTNTDEEISLKFDVVLKKGIVVEGYVRDKDAKPIADVEVSAVQYDKRGVNLLAVYDGENDGPKVIKNNTNTQGYFSFTISAGKYVVSAKKDGFAPAQSSMLNINESDKKLIYLTLFKGGLLSGRVTDAMGNVLKASISCVESTDDRNVRSVSRNTKTEGGNYVIHEITPATYTVQVISDGFVTQTVELEIIDATEIVHDVILDKGLTMSGRVQDEEGNPVAAAELMFFGGESNFNGSLTTDEAGDFSGSGFVIGDFYFNASAARFVSISMQKVTLPLEQDLVITLKKAPSVLVQARDASTQDFLSDYKINVQSTRDFVGGNYDHVQTTEPYSVYLKAPGWSTIRIIANDYAPSKTIKIGSEYLDSDLVLIIDMSQGGGVKGILQNADGTPWAGARVIVEPGGTSPMASLVNMGLGEGGILTDEHGAFELSNVIVGSHLTLVATGAERATFRFENVSVEADKVTDLGVITAAATAKIIGLITDKDGKAVAGTMVMAINMALMDSKMATTESDGSFVIESISPGTIMLQYSIDGKPTMKTITVAAGEVYEFYANVQVISSDLGSLKIYYTIDGQPWKKGDLTLIGLGGATTLVNELKGENGLFQADSLVAGSYMLFLETTASARVPSGEIPIYIRAGEELEKEIHLETGSADVQVIDHFGQAVVGANILIYPTNAPFTRQMFLTLGQLMVPNQRSDAAGNWKTDKLPQGLYECIVSADGFKTVILGLTVSAGVEKSVQAVMKKVENPATLKLKLVNQSGAAVAEVFAIKLCNDRGTPLYQSGGDPAFEQAGVVDGVYELGNLVAGDYLVQIFPVMGGVTYNTWIALTAGQQTEETITITGAGAVEVEVVNSSDNTVSNIAVTLLDSNQQNCSIYVSPRTMTFRGNHTDQNGIFKHQHLAPGQYTVRVDRKDLPSITTTTTVFAGQTSKVRLRVP